MRRCLCYEPRAVLHRVRHCEQRPCGVGTVTCILPAQASQAQTVELVQDQEDASGGGGIQGPVGL